ENRSNNHQGDAGGPVEILLKVELVVAAGSTALDDASFVRRDDLVGFAAALTRPRLLARLARQSRVASRAEKVDGGQSTCAFDVAVIARVDDDLFPFGHERGNLDYHAVFECGRLV